MSFFFSPTLCPFTPVQNRSAFRGLFYFLFDCFESNFRLYTTLLSYFDDATKVSLNYVHAIYSNPSRVAIKRFKMEGTKMLKLLIVRSYGFERAKSIIRRISTNPNETLFKMIDGQSMLYLTSPFPSSAYIISLPPSFQYL